MTVRVDLPVPARALAVGAHPDDIEFGCGATLAKWAAAGAAVTLYICTDGGKGTWDAAADLAALVATREQEQRKAAAVLGAADVIFLGAVDGELVADLPMRAELCRVIRATRPDVVLAHDPWRPYRIHPDHQQAGLIAVDGIVAARDPHFFADQGLDRHRPRQLLCFEPGRIDHLERVDGYIDAKVAALLEHRSQWESTMALTADDRAQRVAFADRISAEARTTGLHAGVRAAEAFARIDDL